MNRLCFVFWALLSGLVQAHGVDLLVQSQEATVLTVRYTNGPPFAFEAYELYAQGAEKPSQLGKTNAQGQIVFLPGEGTVWRVKVFSAHGHGLDRQITLPSRASHQEPEISEPPIPEGVWAVLGLVLLLAGFGCVQRYLLLKAKKKSG